MMDKETVEKIQNDPDYKELLAKRGGFAWTLSIIMLVIYYAYILIIAFDKQLFHEPVIGQYITLGMPVGVGIIVVAFILAGIYVSRANSEFDALTNKIKRKIEGE